MLFRRHLPQRIAIPADRTQSAHLAALLGQGDIDRFLVHIHADENLARLLRKPFCLAVMHIEPATLEDAHAVAEIHVLAWRAVYQGIVPADYLATLSVEKREALWRESIAKGTPELWIARIEGRIIGWVASGPCRDEGANPQAGEVWAIYVTPSHWSSGVGRALWLSARERLQQHGYKSVSLWVLAENSRAIKFYLAAGFAPDLSSTKELTLGGKPLKEVRYEVKLTVNKNVRALMHVIQTANLTLEPQMAAHAEEMFAVLSDPAIYEYENEPPSSIERLRTRFTKLESRQSPTGQEQWLNWVIRLPTAELIGYVQATVRLNGRAAIAYELSSAYWGRGLAKQAVEAMIVELAEWYHVRSLAAVFKRDNQRSMRLLERLGFSPASPEEHVKNQVEPGELLMQREIQRT